MRACGLQGGHGCWERAWCRRMGAGAGVGAWECGVQALAPQLPSGFFLPPASVGSLVFIL